MKIYQSIRTKFASFGYSTKDDDSFDKTQLIRILQFSLIISWHFVYIFHVAETAWEYLFAIFMNSITISMCIAYVSTFLKKQALSAFTVEVESIVNESEF